jgi:hypothetical protein
MTLFNFPIKTVLLSIIPLVSEILCWASLPHRTVPVRSTHMNILLAKIEAPPCLADRLYYFHSLQHKNEYEAINECNLMPVNV